MIVRLEIIRGMGMVMRFHPVPVVIVVVIVPLVRAIASVVMGVGVLVAMDVLVGV